MLSKLIRYFLEQKLVVLLLALLVIIWGARTAPFDWDLGGLPRDPIAVDAIPDIGENQQIVFTEWMGRSPQDMEDQVTYPLTVALLGLPGITLGGSVGVRVNVGVSEGVNVRVGVRVRVGVGVEVSVAVAVGVGVPVGPGTGVGGASHGRSDRTAISSSPRVTILASALARGIGETRRRALFRRASQKGHVAKCAIISAPHVGHVRYATRSRRRAPQPGHRRVSVLATATPQ